MHNVNSTLEIRDDQKNSPKNNLEDADSNISLVMGKGTDTEAIRRSFEDDDENSCRSDDFSRTEAQSQSDDFQTPSASMQNLSSLSQEKADAADSDEDAEDKAPDLEEANPETCLESLQRKHSSSVSLPETSETKSDPIFLQCDFDPKSVSPVESICSISPGNVSGVSDFGQSTESNISKESNSSISSGSHNNNAKIKEKDHSALQPGVYNTKPGRKKMWYHVFTPSYKTRSTDFKKYFKELPVEERLIVDYSCAIQKEILQQGRMFISQNYVSFYANIFGWQSTISIKFKDILTITKENTALVIPNAVQMTTVNDKYFFSSLVNRDATYLMLFKLWQTALLEQPMPSKEIWNLVHSSYGEVEIDSEEDVESTEDYISISSTGSLATGSESTLQSVTASIEKGCSGNYEYEAHIVDPRGLASELGSSAAGIFKSTSAVLGGGSAQLIATDLSDTSDSEEEAIVDEPSSTVIPVCPDPHDDGKIVVDSIIPCDVNTLFTMLFTSSKFYLEFHTMRKTFDIQPQEWQDKDRKTSRQVSFTVTLNQRMGPKHSQITESQILLPQSKPGYFYAVDVESNNAGIPYADAFYVTNHFCMTRVTANQSRLVIVSQVRYRKSIWGLTKSFIEKNSWAGIDEFYSSLEHSLKEECACITTAVSPPPSPRGKAPLRRRALRKKGPAPGIPTIPLTNDGDANVPSVTLMGDRVRSGVEHGRFAFDSTIILRIMLAVLASLLVLNGFLYVKLTRLEASTGSHVFFATPSVFVRELPLTHQEWLELLQRQEALHKFELQKWHNILLSALKILKQAESDLESLKLHLDSYMFTQIHDSQLLKSESSTDQKYPTPEVSPDEEVVSEN